MRILVTGHKGISAFLTTLGARDEVAYAVDINPRKQNTLLAGMGHPVVGSAHLQEAPPDRVIVMKPIYSDEIRRDLDRLGLAPAIVPVTAFARACDMVA